MVTNDYKISKDSIKSLIILMSVFLLKRGCLIDEIYDDVEKEPLEKGVREGSVSRRIIK